MGSQQNASAATLTHLRTSKCNHRDLIATLQRIGSNSIESFHMEFSQLGIATFNRLVELLPHLTELVIHVVVTRITPLFARTIEAAWELKEFNSKGDQIVDGKSGAKVRVDFRVCPADGQLSAYTVPAFDQLRDVLAERCPRLTWVFFHGHYFRFEWQITLGGMTVKEETATILNKARRQSYRPEVFWQRRGSSPLYFVIHLGCLGS
ncbi:hypothetical protein C8R46DRAFT_1062079 [Mycena filopes]|nr:hypothetical protein C8R46DRAFT_1062079 [Mycena filopes]